MTDRELLLEGWTAMTTIYLSMPPKDPKLAEVRQVYLNFDRKLREHGVMPEAKG